MSVSLLETIAIVVGTVVVTVIATIAFLYHSVVSAIHTFFIGKGD